MGKSSGIVCVMVMCMVLSAPHAEAAVSCGTVGSSISPCLGYARGAGPLTAGCCAGVKALYNAASTPADRKTVCTCLKQLAGSYSTFPNAAGIPGKCGVNVPYKISLSTDCSKVG